MSSKKVYEIIYINEELTEKNKDKLIELQRYNSTSYEIIHKSGLKRVRVIFKQKVGFVNSLVPLNLLFKSLNSGFNFHI